MENQKKSDHERHHECELFDGDIPEAAESQRKYKKCTKNPGHEKFKSAGDFKKESLPKIEDVKSQKWLSSVIDITVRVEVKFTSTARPEDDVFSQIRGTTICRTGTGFIWDVFDTESKKIRLPCAECGNDIAKKHWTLTVLTANHVVYDATEGCNTKIDLFMDDELCEADGRMKSLKRATFWKCDRDRDFSYISFATCDEDLGERIKSAWRFYVENSSIDVDPLCLDFLPSCERDCHLGLIVSHPHGQPKKITVGKWRGYEKLPRVKYTVPTCPGSSGAPVLELKYNEAIKKFTFSKIYNKPPFHCGSSDKTQKYEGDQINYGFFENY